MGFIQDYVERKRKEVKEILEKMREKKREKFDAEFRKNIEETAKSMPRGGACDNTVRQVADLMGFSQQGLTSGSIRVIIDELRELEKSTGKVKELSGPQEAQLLANDNTGDYLIIAAVANFAERTGPDPRNWKGGKHHIAFVVRDLNTPPNNPMCGGGGLEKRYFSYIFSHAGWHMSFEYKAKEMEDPQTAVKYFQYGIKS